MGLRGGARGHRPWGRVIAVLGAVAALSLTACSSSNDGWSVPGSDTSGSSHGSSHEPKAQAAPKPTAKVTMRPRAGAKGVSPVAPAKVTVSDGTIESLALTNPAGKKVTGELAADHKSWTVGEPLGFSKTYTWSGTAVGTDGAKQKISGDFTTVTPNGTTGASINTGDGKTYGVAMPIAVTFDNPVEDKAAAEHAMKVQTSVPVEGAWAWLDDQRAHWRPRNYWPAGTKVTVNLKLYGVNYGGGVFGSDDMTSQFTIGRNQVVKANTKTHRVLIYRGGKLVQNFPASMGLDSDPGRVTNSGTHVVMDKHEKYRMTNRRYKYFNVEVPWAVRISNNGEFIHGYGPSVPQQGNTNVSHGCVNLSPDNAKIYYDEALTGDPVEITGSTNQLDPSDGDYYDWAIPWAKWVGMSAGA
jgi:lipoprotein-anchoring transpeptidase ErfK/SrfK